MGPIASLSVVYVFIIGVFFVAFSLQRLRAIYRFVEVVLKVPGPSWWNLATVHAKHLLGDDTIAYLCKFCEEYSYKPFGLFTISLDFLVFVSDPDDVSEVFKNPYTCDKSHILYGGLADYLPKGSLVLNGDRWKWHRKTISPAFRKRNLDARIHVLSEGADDIAQVLRKKADGPEFDMTDIIDVGTTELSLRFITSEVPMVPSARRFYEAVETGMSLVQSKTLNPVLHWFLLRFGKKTRGADQLARSAIAESEPIFKQAKVVAKNRLNNRLDSQPVDVIECLAQPTFVPELEVDEREILDEALTMAVGAMETTRTAIKFVIMLLALNPVVQERVFQEIQTIFGEEDRRASPQDLQDMKYLDAVIKESLRLYPPIPLIGRQVSRTTKINGMMIPRGACVIMNLMAMQRSPALYKDPLTFLPERFLTEAQEERHSYAFLPFGSGHRTCVGYVQAIMTLKVVLTTILRNFRIIPGEKIKSIDDLKIKMSVSITFREPMIKLISREKKCV